MSELDQLRALATRMLELCDRLESEQPKTATAHALDPIIYKPRLNITEVGEVLGVDRKTVYRRMRRLGLRQGADRKVSAKDVAKLLEGSARRVS